MNIMYKYMTVLMLFFSLSITSQNQNLEIIELKKSLHSLSNNDFEYNVRYLKDKETIYFETIKLGQVTNGYKLIIKDIHPQGVFPHQESNTYSIRILSLNNGHVFIKENLDKKYRRSNTTNYVDIGSWDESYKSNLLTFIVEFKKFINKTNPKKATSLDDDEVIIVTDKKNDN